MKHALAICSVLVCLAAVIVSGCTSSAPAPATPVATQSAPAAAVTPVPAAAAAMPPITGTTWKLGWFDDTKGIWSKVAEGSTITATFGTDGKVIGSSGCSDYSTDYHLGTDPKLWIRRPEVPTKICQAPTGVMKQESAYDTDLSWSEDYAITGNQLVMFDKTGKKILQFDPS
jgi:heat shock protein HslJ